MPPLSSPNDVRAKDLMHKEVHRVDKDAHLEDVIKLMKRHRVSKVPVTDGGRIVGIVTDGMIADKLGALHNKNVATNTLHASSVMVRAFRSATPEDPWKHVLGLLDQDGVGMVPVVHDGHILGVLTKADLLGFVTDARPVRDLAGKHVHTVLPQDRVMHARRLMLDHGIERLPVVDQGAVRGIVSEMDIAVALDVMKKRIEQKHHARHLEDLQVRDVMNAPAVTCGPATSARDAARTMRDQGIGCLPLVDDRGHLVGLVTRSDLLRAVAGSNGG